jgi:hypothetical protein
VRNREMIGIVGDLKGKALGRREGIEGDHETLFCDYRIG